MFLKMDDVFVLISDDLNFYVLWMFDEFFEVYVWIVEGCLSFGLSLLNGGNQGLFIGSDLYFFIVIFGGSFDEYGEVDFVGIGDGD